MFRRRKVAFFKAPMVNAMAHASTESAEEETLSLKTQLDMLKDLEELYEKTKDPRVLPQLKSTREQISQAIKDLNARGIDLTKQYAKFGSKILQMQLLQSDDYLKQRVATKGEEHIFIEPEKENVRREVHDLIQKVLGIHVPLQMVNEEMIQRALSEIHTDSAAFRQYVQRTIQQASESVKVPTVETRKLEAEEKEAHEEDKEGDESIAKPTDSESVAKPTKSGEPSESVAKPTKSGEPSESVDMERSADGLRLAIYVAQQRAQEEIKNYKTQLKRVLKNAQRVLIDTTDVPRPKVPKYEIHEGVEYAVESRTHPEIVKAKQRGAYVKPTKRQHTPVPQLNMEQLQSQNAPKRQQRKGHENKVPEQTALISEPSYEDMGHMFGDDNDQERNEEHKQVPKSDEQENFNEPLETGGRRPADTPEVEPEIPSVKKDYTQNLNIIAQMIGQFDNHKKVKNIMGVQWFDGRMNDAVLKLPQLYDIEKLESLALSLKKLLDKAYESEKSANDSQKRLYYAKEIKQINKAYTFTNNVLKELTQEQQ